MYTAMYGGSIENAAPLPVLPIVMACVCAPAAAIVTECVCAPADAMLSECEWLPFVLVQPVHEREASKLIAPYPCFPLPTPHVGYPGVIDDGYNAPLPSSCSTDAEVLMP